MVPAMTRILVISGSARKESVNGKLAKVACGMASEMEAEAEWIDPRDYVLPLYDGDLEEASGLPDAAKLLKAKFILKGHTCYRESTCAVGCRGARLLHG
jgi:hypothetical protein